MARGKSLVPTVLLVSFIGILILIAVVNMLFPGVLRDGFRDVPCYGTKCGAGEFCQDNSCKKINPPYTNNYFTENFQDQEEKEKEEVAEGFRASRMASSRSNVNALSSSLAGFKLGGAVRSR